MKYRVSSISTRYPFHPGALVGALVGIGGGYRGRHPRGAGVPPPSLHYSRAAAPKKKARWEKTAAVKPCNHTCLDGQDDNGKDDDINMIIDIDR